MKHRAAAAFAVVSLLLAGGAARAAQAAHEVTGFRSATFGMTETEVQSAIRKDFGIRPKAIHVGENPTEHTKVLSAVVDGLVPDTGKGAVSYVLGYHSHRLIQVGVTWSPALDPHVTPKTLVTIASMLQADFVGQGYLPNTVVTNAALNNGGILVFRGEDKSGHATVLILQGKREPSKVKGKETLIPTELDLFYAEDPKHPDALHLKSGQF